MTDQKDVPLGSAQDKRGFFMLPRSPAESDYYTYDWLNGEPDRSAYQYDREGTAKLIELFCTFAPVTKIFFNYTNFPFVTWRGKHDDHFYVELMR